ncbi:MAG: alpha/beta fold hydrolase [Pseudomonadota bacterium]
MTPTISDPKTLDLPIGRVVYLDSGPSDGPVVVLLHGGGLDCARLSWRCLLPELAGRYRVIAPNWPGYAGSAPFDRPYQIADLGVWLIAVLDRLGIERASLVGVSMGGGAALWTAAHHPERVTALIPVGTFGVAPKAPFHLLSYVLTHLPLNAASFALLRRSRAMLRRALEALFADPGKLTDALVDEVAEVLSEAGSGQAFTQFQRGEMALSGLRTALRSELDEMQHPTLFVHGRKDALVPLAAVEAAAARMPQARLEILEAGHWPMRECPDAFNRLVLDFLSQHAAA